MPRRPKFDPTGQPALLDAESGPVQPKGGPSRSIARKRKPKGGDTPNYGRGVPELYDTAGHLAHDWRQRFDALSDEKKLGVRAHAAFLKVFEQARSDLDRSQPGYLAAYTDRVKADLEAWKARWGHIPGWWNWF